MDIWPCPLDMFQEPSLIPRPSSFDPPSFLLYITRHPTASLLTSEIEKQREEKTSLREFTERERERERERESCDSASPASMERVASSCVSLLAQRRAYSAAAAMAKGAGKRADEKKAAAAAAKRVMGKKEVNTAAAAAEKTAWVPDPATGYYRPAGGASKEVDAAELRAKLLTRAAN